MVLLNRPPIDPASRAYWVIVKLIGVEPCKDPDDAVTMTLYVPAGVPPEFEELPHPRRLRIKANVVMINTAPTDEMGPWRRDLENSTTAGSAKLTRARLDHGKGCPAGDSPSGSTLAIWLPLVVIVTDTLAGTLFAGTLDGLNEHWLRPGRPEQAKVTGPASVPCVVTCKVSVPACPCMIVKELGAAESERTAGPISSLTTPELIAPKLTSPE